MKLESKVELLKQSNQISTNTFNNVLKAIEILKTFNLNLEKNAGSMFVIHFAKALQRVEEGEAEVLDVSQMLKELEEEILQDAEEKLKNIQNHIKIEFKQGEREYLLIYLSSLIIESKGE